MQDNFQRIDKIVNDIIKSKDKSELELKTLTKELVRLQRHLKSKILSELEKVYHEAKKGV